MQLDGSCAAQEIDLLFSPSSIFLYFFFFYIVEMPLYLAT